MGEMLQRLAVLLFANVQIGTWLQPPTRLGLWDPATLTIIRESLRVGGRQFDFISTGATRRKELPPPLRGENWNGPARLLALRLATHAGTRSQQRAGDKSTLGQAAERIHQLVWCLRQRRIARFFRCEAGFRIHRGGGLWPNSI